MKTILALSLALALHSFAGDDDSARVFIYRDAAFVGSGLQASVKVDGEKLVTIQSGTYYGGIFPAGTRTFELYDGLSGARLDLEAGKAYYIRLSVVPGVFVGSFDLTVIDHGQGSYEVEKLRHVGDAEIANKSVPLVTDPTYPERITLDRMRTLAENLARRRRFPESLRSVPADAWGTRLRYVASPDGLSYTLVSAGADREFDEASWTGEPGIVAAPADDAVLQGSQGEGVLVRRWKLAELTEPDSGE